MLWYMLHKLETLVKNQLDFFSDIDKTLISMVDNQNEKSFSSMVNLFNTPFTSGFLDFVISSSNNWKTHSFNVSGKRYVRLYLVGDTLTGTVTCTIYSNNATYPQLLFITPTSPIKSSLFYVVDNRLDILLSTTESSNQKVKVFLSAK